MYEKSSKVSGLSPEELDLLVARLREKGAAGKSETIPLLSREPGVFPLSPAQERIWFLEQLESGTPTYNIAFALDLEGDLDSGALAWSLQELVRRHEALGTTFHAVGGEPKQLPSPDVEVSLAVTDLGSLPRSVRLQQVEQIVEQEVRKPFDLLHGPLLRAHLLRLGKAQNTLVLVFHHLVADGWSAGVLIRELAHYYSQRMAGQAPRMPALPIQYIDFAAWQRKRLAEGAFKDQLAYWRRQLEGCARSLDLPFDRPRPRIRSSRGARRLFRLPGALARRLDKFSEDRGVTLFTVLFATLSSLLHRYTSQTDFLIASPMANRNRSELEGLVGCFVNTVVLRTRLTVSTSFSSLVQRLHEVVAGATANQDLPFEQLVQDLDPERSLSQAPLAQVMLVLEPPQPAVRLPGLKLGVRELDTGTSKFDLMLSIRRSPESLEGSIEYSSESFDATTIERLAGHWRRLLESVSMDTEQRLTALPMLSAAERQTLMVEWNATTRQTPREATLSGLFREQVARTPEALALVVEGRCLSYAELARQARLLGARLRRLGVCPEERVGVLLPRHESLVVAILGILDAGGVYVPLDSQYPKQRLAFMLADARAQVVVSVQEMEPVLEESSVRCVWLAGRQEERSAVEEEPVGSTAEQLAYVIYTSGSTGRPKAVAITHRSAVDMVSWGLSAFSRAETSGVLATSSICFDLSVFELFVPLAGGGTVVLIDDVLAFGPQSEASRVSLINTVPSVIAELVRLNAVPTSVRTVNLAGEVLHNDLVQEIYRRTNVERVLNLYGPSEDTTYSTWTRIGRGARRAPTIGRPVANTQVYLVDGGLWPVPPGAVGELCLGGESLARGYLGRVGLSAERFVPDPFGADSGRRLYRTGDLARYRRNGELEFLGRSDHQVKVRGFRIELGEVEEALSRHPAVREAVVVVSELAGQGRLAAYVVSEETGLDEEALSRFLGTELPDFMVPSLFLPLDSLPRNPNGKVDRRALPAPSGHRLRSTTEYVAPRNSLEYLLAEIWSALLDVQSVGVHDNFFALGGHSLLAAQLGWRVREACRVEVPVHWLFESPTVAELAACIEAHIAPPQVAPPIVPIPRDGELLPSYGQERLWFLHQLEGPGALYNMPVAVQLEGALDVAALDAGLRQIECRHEALRSYFQAHDGRPLLRIAAPSLQAVPIADLSHLPEPQRQQELSHLTQQMAEIPFDLVRGPLWRPLLLRREAEHHRLVVTLHHSIADGVSLNVLLRELAELYSAHLERRPAQLETLPVQYLDYAAWQRQWLKGDALESRLLFWREQLAAAPASLELPTDRPRGQRPGYRGAHLPYRFGADLAARLTALSRRLGGTPFLTVLTTFTALLYRITGQDDVLVGTPVANRESSQLAPLIGFFANTVVLRSRPRSQQTFLELFQQVRRTSFGAYAHQDLPFSRLVEALQPERQLAQSPFFQVMLASFDVPPRPELPGLKTSFVESSNGASKFDLTLFIHPASELLSGTLEYSTELFDATTVRRFVSHLRCLLESVIATPECQLGELPLLSPVERWQMLEEWNSMPAREVCELAMVQLFKTQAKRTPEVVALRCGERTSTYAELDRRVQGLAHELRRRGVAPETLVAVCMERSVEMVVALLAVLEAGGAYVPVDPTYPLERLHFMIEDCAASIVLTGDRAPELPATVQRLEVPSGPLEFAVAPEPAAVRVGADSLAYVIYTSGSTGRPKGVAITQRSALNLLYWGRDQFTAEELSGVLAATSISFDLSVFEIFVPLSWGGTVVLVDNALSLASLPAAAAVRLVNTVPSAMAELVRLAAVPPSVTTVNLAGEALTNDLVQRLYSESRVTRVLNLYGPSEDTTYSTAAVVTRGARMQPAIGRPVSASRAYAVDPRGRLAVPGGLAELCLGGDKLARGYLGRPALSAESFVPDPFAEQPGRRMYKTGDRVRLRADGTLDFLGRLDHQVKVRGFRIEPGEIEAALSDLDPVAEAVVTAPEVDGGRRLVAYVVGAAGTPSAQEVRAALLRRLPEHLVPSSFVFLEALPRTPNGKVDRRTLPLPDSLQVASDAFVAPRSGTEQLLAEIWEDVLNRGPVGVHQNFFELGGHSLLVTRVMSRIREVFGAELPLRSLFEAPTLASLAEGLAAVQLPSPVPPIERRTTEGSPPMSFAQERLWFLDRLEPGDPTYNIAAAVHLRGVLEPAAMERSFAALTKRHEALRTFFELREGEPQQLISPRVSLPLQVLDLTALPASRRRSEFDRCARWEARGSFELARPPLWRARLVRLTEREHILLLTVHHILTDGWSMRLLVRELAALYGVETGQPGPPLPPLPITYSDYAAWQRRWLESDALTAQLVYWQRQLGRELPVLELPTDRPRRAASGHRAVRRRLELEPELSQELRDIGRRHGATLFMTLLTAFKIFLWRITGQVDVVVGCPIAGRNRAEVEGLVGIFLNSLALRTKLGAGLRFEAALARVRDTAVAAYVHQDVPFEKLLEHLQPDRDLSRTSIFQVFFNMLNLPAVKVQLPELKVEEIPTPEVGAKFDLTVYVEEQQERIHIDWVYNADLFDAERIAAMQEQFRFLLEQVVEHPTARIDSYSLLAREESSRLPDSRAALQPADWRGAVHVQISQQARRSPQQVALVDRHTSWTYRDLEERSDRVARWLRETGVGPGDGVAIYAHRSAPLVQAVLGVWKAGAAFLILDPSYPASRLAAGLRQVAPRAWITVASAGRPPEALAEWTTTSHLELDDLGDGTPSTTAMAAPAVEVAPEDVAYFAFTSGSTGKPKAVVGCHRPVAHFIGWQVAQFGLQSTDRFTMLSGLSHDPLLRDLFTPLSLGATLCIPDPEVLESPAELLTWLATEQVTVCHLTPALGQMLVAGRALTDTSLPTLRWAFFGGDRLHRQDLRELSRLAPQVRSVNFYGATETPQVMSWFEPSENETAESIPVGHGIAGVDLLILNQAGGLAGVGEQGEIHIRTPFLSLGYLNDEKQTAERFLTNPFTAEPADRVYRTGDLGRYRPDGAVELTGRADQQVKIRGFRIEPAEVEAALVSDPEVREAVVIAVADGPRQTRLVAYVVPVAGATPNPAELRQRLRQIVPSYMVPAAFVVLEALPLTPQGKVDRRALPEVSAGDGLAERSFVAPRNPVEQVVAEIWSDILGVPQIGVQDDFFELGGHSLLAARLMARIAEGFQVNLALRSLFKNPTVAGVSESILQLRDADSEGGAPMARLPKIVVQPGQRHEPFPLTDIQQAYWVGRTDALGLGRVASHRYLELESQDLDLRHLERAWHRLVEYHDMLRAVILPDGRQQILAEVPPYEIEVVDLRDHGAEDAARQLAATRERMSHQVLPADRWPLFEIRALLLPAGRVRVCLSFDLLIADAWSFRILERQVLELYGDPAAELPSLELSFRDYVLGELALQESELYQRSLAYWRERLPTLPPGPELPLTRDPETLDDKPRFVRRSLELAPEIWQQLRGRASRSALTPSGVLLAAFSEVLAAWSKTPCFTIVLTLFNRLPVHPEVDALLGDFTSTTLLAVEPAVGETFKGRARRLQERLWSDLDHRYVSGVEVNRQLAREGHSGSVSPVVFTSTLDLRAQEEDGEQELPGEIVYSVSQTPQVLLDHQVSEREGTLYVNWDAVEEVFPTGLLESMFTAYRDLLYRLAEEEVIWQQQTVHLVPGEQLRHRAKINNTAAPLPAGLLHDGFLEQARRHPERPAVLTGSRVLSYGELAAASRTLAWRLRQLKVQPNSLVGVVMEKGWEQVVAVLGILQAGAAYLPVDAHQPRERREYLLHYGQVEVVLTQSWFEQTLEWPQEIVRIVVDTLEPASGGEKPLEPVQAPEDLAYVIFTSGSTGLPKGVMIEHHAALNTVADVNQRFAVGPEDRVLALSALNFDLSVYDIFGLLGAGGAIVFPEPEAGRDPGRWLELMAEHGVTFWNTVPTLMEMLVEYVRDRPETHLEGLRVALLSGDWIPLQLVPRLHELCPTVEVISLGGATEVSIWSILYPISAVDAAWSSIPYGRPMVNQTFHVLDQAMAPRPEWVPGELYIGGVGLARGYWRDEQKTQAAFVLHPESGERLYRTWDLGRYLPDGDIEFLGRQDFQVKIQGHRIELGEIEAALEQHPAVRSAVVVAVGPQRGPRHLQAFVVFAQEAPPDRMVAELPEALRRKLPEYMVPADIAALETLPLTPNGKVDRGALADLAATTSAAESTKRQAPRNRLEEQVVEIWCELLNIDSLGVTDSLFELGGNSLSAIRLLGRMRQQFQVEVPLRELFLQPTVEGLTKLLEKEQSEQAEQFDAVLDRYAIVPDPASQHRPFPLNEVQQAYWLGRTDAFELGNVAAHSYVELESEHLDLPRLNVALSRVIERHSMLRAIILPDGQQRVLEEVPGYEIEVLDLSEVGAEEVERQLAEVRQRMSHQVLPAHRWPLFEIRASRLPGDVVRLHLSLDMLVVDAWSSRILAREIGLFYADPERHLPPLEVTFRDYVLAEQAFRSAEFYRRAQEYWNARMSTLPPAPELPMAKNPRDVETHQFQRRSGILPVAHWRRLKERAGEVGITPSGLLLAAFSQSLAAWSKTSRFTLNVTTFNRLPLHQQIDSVVGDFTTLTLLQVEADTEMGFDAHARRVQEQLWQDLEHRHFGGVEVLRQLARSRGGGPVVLMPVVFTSLLFDYQEEETPEQAVEGPTLGGEVQYSVSQTPQVWLDHGVSERAGELLYRWDSLEEIFPHGLLDDLFAAYQQLLTDLVQVEDWGEVKAPPLPAWQQVLLAEVNSTEAPLSDALLQTPFEQQAARLPDHPAVIAGDRVLTYSEIEARANRLGHALRRQGASPNQLVAVVMEKGWQQVVAVLAVLKAGAAYLPIDPALPTARITHLLEYGEVRWVLTQAVVDKDLEWPPEVERWVVEDPLLPEMPESIPPPVQGVEDLAYVIFTSGSTGLPKGVMIHHQGALNTVLDINSRYGVEPCDRVLALSSLNFDLSVYDVFGVLGAGGTIVMPDPLGLRDPEHWAELIAEHDVTLWNSVPALMELLVESESARPVGRVNSLRVVMLSGDWIPVRQPDRLRELAAPDQIISLGGATEASIWSILFPIREVDSNWTSIPYGRPMLNQRFHVLDAALRPCPVWVPGELYIAGVGVAKGYWRDAERTAASFVVHPRTGETLYRTGDLGRYLDDGNIEFLGREDFQVKIQGHRIELGEIEANLEEHPAVRSAVLAAVGPARGKRRLVAYVVLEDPSQPRSAEAPVVSASVAPPAPDTAVVERSLERLEFKLRQPGLRQDEGVAPRVHLPGSEPEDTWAAFYRARRSQREFSAAPVPAPSLQRLLMSLGQLRLDGQPFLKARYPSAGNLYPVQAYVFVKAGRVEGVAAGIYYFDPVDFKLVQVREGDEIQRTVCDSINQPVFDRSAFAVFLIARLGAIAPMYGSLTPDFCLLEAGYMGQLMMLSALDNDLGLCPIGSLDFESIRPLFALEEGQVLLHTLLGGPLPTVDDTVDADRDGPVEKFPGQPLDSRIPAWRQMASALEGVEGGQDLQLREEVERLEFKLRALGRRVRQDEPVVGLGEVAPAEELAASFRQRRSDRRFLSRAVPLKDLGRLLASLAQITPGELPLARYPYPSAGNLYPVQTYLEVREGRVAELAAGAYYYHPREHALVPLTLGEQDRRDLYGEVNQPVYEQAAFAIYLVAQQTAIDPVYGPWALDFCLLEAGYMSQLLMVDAPDHSLGLCPVGTLEFDRLRESFHLDATHRLVHTHLGGVIAERRDPRAAFSLHPASAAIGPPAATSTTPVPTEDLREDLRGHLASKLPEYMVPTMFVVLDRLPLTANGKVDRSALPVPEEEALAGQQDFLAPRTPVEEMLAGLWGQVLGSERVGVSDSFFELGGDSLRATQLILRLRETFQVELPLRDLFEVSSLGGLAEKIEAALLLQGGLSIPPIVALPRQSEHPVSFAQERLWFIEQLESGSPFYNIVTAKRLTGTLRISVFQRVLEEIVRRHESLRTVFVSRGGQPGQKVLPTGPVALPLIDLMALPAAQQEKEARGLARTEHGEPFDLVSGPLLRVKLLRLSERRHVIVFALHHIIADGWSMGVLVDEVKALYEAFSEGLPSPLPELPVQYIDFTVWQRQWLRDEVLDRQLAYWREQLAGAPTLMDLPIDHPRPAIQSYRGGELDFEISQQLTEQLEELSRRQGCTLFMTLLAAFQTLLRFETGKDDILVSSAISYRNWAEVADLVGFFVNVLVFRTRFSGDPTVCELLTQVRQTSLEGYAHQHLPFRKLVEDLRPERSLSHNPLLQTALDLGQRTPAEASDAELVVSPFEFDVKISQFELSIRLNQTEEGMHGVFQYRRDLFESATIRWLAAQYRHLLSEMVRDPDQRLSDLEKLLGHVRERRQTTLKRDLKAASSRKLKKGGRTRRAVAVVARQNDED